jgi:hypothetical protein
MCALMVLWYLVSSHLRGIKGPNMGPNMGPNGDPNGDPHGVPMEGI